MITSESVYSSLYWQHTKLCEAETKRGERRKTNGCRLSTLTLRRPGRMSESGQSATSTSTRHRSGGQDSEWIGSLTGLTENSCWVTGSLVSHPPTQVKPSSCVGLLVQPLQRDICWRLRHSVNPQKLWGRNCTWLHGLHIEDLKPVRGKYTVVRIWHGSEEP